MNTMRHQAARTLAVLLILGGVRALAAPVEVTDPPEASPPPGVIALVNGEAVRVAELEKLLGTMHQSVSVVARPDFDFDQLLFRLVNDALIAQEARAMGLHEEPEVAGKVDAYRDKRVLETYEQREILAKAEPSDEQLRQGYDYLYHVVQLRVVTAREEEQAEAMLEELRAGVDMATIARERSVDPIGIREGLMKPAPRFDLQREVADVAFALEPGDLGGPVRTDLGWTVIRVESFLPADPERFERRASTVRGILKQQAAGRIRTELAEELRERFPVSIDTEVVATIQPGHLPDGRLEATIDDPEAVVATVGESAILAREYGEKLFSRWKGVRNVEAATAAAPIVLGGMIEKQLIMNEAKRLEYPKLPEIREAVRRFESDLIVPRFLEEVVAADVTITSDELREYYDDHPDRFRQPPRLRLGQITVASIEEAERLVELLEGGADFAWLARRHSTDRFKDQGGDRGWYQPMPGIDEFNDSLLRAEAGDVLDPLGAMENYRVIKILDSQPQDVYPFEEVSGNVRAAVFSEKFKETLHLYITKLRERSEIRIYEDRVQALRITGEKSEDAGGMPGGHAH